MPVVLDAGISRMRGVTSSGERSFSLVRQKPTDVTLLSTSSLKREQELIPVSIRRSVRRTSPLIENRFSGKKDAPNPDQTSEKNFRNQSSGSSSGGNEGGYGGSHNARGGSGEDENYSQYWVHLRLKSGKVTKEYLDVKKLAQDKSNGDPERARYLEIHINECRHLRNSLSGENLEQRFEKEKEILKKAGIDLDELYKARDNARTEDL